MRFTGSTAGVSCTTTAARTACICASRGDGVLELGYYEGAIPHIGEAVFTPKDTVQHRSYSEAFKSACQIGGRQFKIDVFLWDQDVTTPTLGAPEMELGYGS